MVIVLGMFLGFAAGAVFASYAQATCRRVEVNFWESRVLMCHLLWRGAPRSLEIASELLGYHVVVHR